MLKWRMESKETYYDTLVEWWNSWGFPKLEKSSIPNRIFVVYKEVSDQLVDLYAIPVYIGDADLCWLGFPTSNRVVPRPEKEGALEFIMDKVETCMKYEGYNMMITTSNTPKLMELFESRGFGVADQGTNYYTKML